MTFALSGGLVLLPGADPVETTVVIEAVDDVFDHAEQRDFIYEHAWTVGDFVIWDNLSCTHARTHFDLGDDRRLRRGKVSGTVLAA